MCGMRKPSKSASHIGPGSSRSSGRGGMVNFSEESQDSWVVKSDSDGSNLRPRLKGPSVPKSSFRSIPEKS